MIIEQLNASQAEYAYSICQGSHPFPWSYKAFVDCLEPPYFAYQFNQSNHIVGYYIGLQVADEVTLMDIAIARDHQGFGHGRALLSHCVEQTIERGASACWLEVRVSNTNAIALYKACGFKPIETRKGYYPSVIDSQDAASREDALIMCRVCA